MHVYALKYGKNSSPLKTVESDPEGGGLVDCFNISVGGWCWLVLTGWEVLSRVITEGKNIVYFDSWK